LPSRPLMGPGDAFASPAWSFCRARLTVLWLIFIMSATSLVDFDGASLRIISRSRARSALDRCRLSTFNRIANSLRSASSRLPMMRIGYLDSPSSRMARYRSCPSMRT